MATKKLKDSKWTKELKKEIWNDYVTNKIFKYWPSEQDRLTLENWNLAEEAPCQWCAEIMLRAQFFENQPKAKQTWDVAYLDFNSKYRSVINLQPMHPWCKKERKESTLIK